MGSSHRIAAVAAVSHAKHYYNYTRPDVQTVESSHYTVNIFFVSATLCGILVAVCAACWRRSSPSHKPDAVVDYEVYTISADDRLQHPDQEDLPGPPPAYESVIDDSMNKDCTILQEVVSEPCPEYKTRVDSGLPSYEAAVMLRDTKL
ncbi:uncharacterized protein LOC112052878 [Bicyclus anynana]|uniref:Uncharacterized protein LOC112052878 n=1 Tax=Bicyclus anynana TaxID=110368 RepID=A0A6J1NJF9_BICAN|nr:uncharacterized protein LOC112052878 [Bicyclus anynana]XP_023947880.2 uncharacterized protein LOC112052878 [Bicyclus anynana]